MTDHASTLMAIFMIAAIVYLTRLGGYFIGLQLRHIAGIQPILESLPGCAFMAILAPAVRQGTTTEIIALLCVLGIMWKTNNVVVATITGMTLLVFGDSLLEWMDPGY